MQCDECNEEISADSKFCEHCGKKISHKIKKLDETSQSIISHLEFLGYEIEKLPGKDTSIDSFVARHANRSNLVMNIKPNFGTSVVSSFTLSNVSSKNEKSFFEVINMLNKEAILCSFSYFSDDPRLLCSSWYPPGYDKSTFSKYIEMHESDIKARLQNDKLQSFA